MSSHQGFQALATRLINQHGRIVTLKSKSTNGGSSWRPILTNSDQPTKAVQSKFTYSEMQGGLVAEGDKMFLVDSVIVPDVSMQLVDDQDFSIVSVSEVKPGDQSILFRVHCRG